MNIKQVEVEEVEDLSTRHFMEPIVERQKELMEKYHEIEEPWKLSKVNPLVDEIDVNNKAYQLTIKAKIYHCFEELMETYDAMIDKDKSSDAYSYLEEAIDALHFITELGIMIDFNFDMLPKLMDLEKMDRLPQDIIFDILYSLAFVGHKLKNKEWKQTYVETDVEALHFCYKAAIVGLFQLFKRLDLNDLDVVNLYLKKAGVNEFRQRSKY